ncbi:MAG: hypothetical protein GXO69_08285 [Acidobacteria bacterium]|nr:hypothetical protein [Acidobacteriota bacterium]
MKLICFLAVIFLFPFSVFAQQADTIIQKNLFDPQRGQVEAADTSGPVEEELPKDIPILDGIITIGSYQRVIFRYRDEKSHKIVSGVFKKGDKFLSAKILQILPNEVTIAFMGKKYKMTVDSKDKMKNIPKTSGFHNQHFPRPGLRKTSPEVVTRKVPVRPRTSRRTGITSRRSGGSTPFGGVSRTGKRPKSRKSTPF